MRLNATWLAGTGIALALGLAGSGAFAKDSGFKIMMTPKWTGFPYFEAAAKGGKAAADGAWRRVRLRRRRPCGRQPPGRDAAELSDPEAGRHRTRGDRPQRRRAGAEAGAQKGHRRDDVRRRRGAGRARHVRQSAVLRAGGEDHAGLRAARRAERRRDRLHRRLADVAQPHGAHQDHDRADQGRPKYQVFKVVDTQFADDDDAKSYDVAVNLMQAHPNLKVIISSSAVSAPAAARAIVGERPRRQGVRHRLRAAERDQALPRERLAEGFALWDPVELGYLAAYVTHLKLAGKLDLTPGRDHSRRGKAGTFTVGKDGEIVYGKPSDLHQGQH